MFYNSIFDLDCPVCTPPITGNTIAAVFFLFQNVRQFIQPFGDFLFRLLYLLSKGFSFFFLEKPCCFGKLCFQLRQHAILQIADYLLSFCTYYQIQHCAELCHRAARGNKAVREICRIDPRKDGIHCHAQNQADEDKWIGLWLWTKVNWFRWGHTMNELAVAGGKFQELLQTQRKWYHFSHKLVHITF